MASLLLQLLQIGSGLLQIGGIFIIIKLEELLQTGETIRNQNNLYKSMHKTRL